MFTLYFLQEVILIIIRNNHLNYIITYFLLACSVGVLYGSNSGSEGRLGALFLTNVSTGSLIYNDNGWCDRGADGLSGPVVDQHGYVYFRCTYVLHLQRLGTYVYHYYKELVHKLADFSITRMYI